MDHEGKEVELEVPPHLFVYKDGSVRRSDAERLVSPSPDPGHDGVASKDLSFNAHLALWARIYLPSPLHQHQKLPVVLYFHGGGFIFGSPAWNNFHAFCTDMVIRSSCICVSASYRLAPEHRLPVAFDDGFEALQWLHLQSRLQYEGKQELMDAWMVHADFSKCFIAGESAGGMLAHHVVMRAMNKPLNSASWEPLCIKGLILIHPGFLRGTRTQEELDCKQDMYMNWNLADTCMHLTLPSGTSKDNPYFNPLLDMSSRDVSFVLPKTLVALADKDALHYMVLDYIQALKDAGCVVDMVMSHDVGHVFFIEERESEQAHILMDKITKFITDEP